MRCEEQEDRLVFRAALHTGTRPAAKGQSENVTRTAALPIRLPLYKV